MNTLLLSTDNWDLGLDVEGNIAVATGGYALAQDAACAILTFLGEVYYATTLGVAWQNILAALPPINYVRAQCVAAAEKILASDIASGIVTDVAVYFTAFSERLLSGQVQITDSSGTVTVASF